MVRPGICGSPDRLASSRKVSGSSIVSASSPVFASSERAAAGRGRGSALCSRAAGGERTAGRAGSAQAESVSSKYSKRGPAKMPASIARRTTRPARVNFTSIPLRRSRIGVIDDPSVAVRETPDLGHLGRRELEVEDCEIFRQPFAPAGPRDAHYPRLHQETQPHPPPPPALPPPHPPPPL